MKLFKALANLFVSNTHGVTDEALIRWAKSEYRNDPYYAINHYCAHRRMPEVM